MDSDFADPAALRAGASLRVINPGVFALEVTVKSMTCREHGGKCDQKLTANSWDEMVKVMTKHVMEKHPDVAKTMEKMHNEDPKKWGKQMKPKSEAAPEA
jgi:hypothetical protein